MKTVRNFSHDDDYIEKMAQFYTSEMAVKLFPYIRKIPFYEWLQKESEKRYQKIG